MQSRNLIRPFNPPVRDPQAVRWATQQALMDWALRKSGGGLVPVVYKEAEWWNHFLNGGTLRMMDD